MQYKNMPPCQYKNSHCGGQTILLPSYLHNGISYIGMTIFLYQIGVLGVVMKTTLSSLMAPDVSGATSADEVGITMIPWIFSLFMYKTRNIFQDWY